MTLSFIWHMHQPNYRDKDGIMQMPWVFLHAIKDYYDMPWIVSHYPEVKLTFNITAPLIEQLKLYSQEAEKSDKFLSLWLREPQDLVENERRWLIKICKSSHYETMVKPFTRYRELVDKEHYNDREFLNLEILFILSWCGNYLQKNNAVVQQLFQKEQNYTVDDKKILLATLIEFIAGIWSFYKKLYQSKQIVIATTPFYHPILPLLLDMQNAKKANPNTQIPKETFSLKEDATRHIIKAKELFRETFGSNVKGFWPAEGAVDEESVELLASQGIHWIATDEEVLYKSLGNKEKKNIYFPYRYKNVAIGFRDHRLSDLIGFEYRYKSAKDAVQSFLLELEVIQKNDENAHVYIVLDGENAWEYYPKNGFDFLHKMYESLQNISWCSMLTMDEISKMQTKTLSHLAAGSWINGTFDTWVGDREKIRAWELLFMTKRDYNRHYEHLTQKKRTLIDEKFLFAESSDWFWWYGNDHHSEFDNEFDLLFRNNLVTIYELMEIYPPHDLFIPLVKKRSSGDFLIHPQSDITPIIDGKKDSFFEWMGCGVVDESQLFSTMDRTKQLIKKIYYGQDSQKLYFAFEGVSHELCKKGMIHLIIDPLKIEIEIAFCTDAKNFSSLRVESACKDWLELSIEKKNIKVQKLALRFEIYTQEGALQTLPSFGDLLIDLNDDYSKNWFV